jgi:hypothetical protein
VPKFSLVTDKTKKAEKYNNLPAIYRVGNVQVPYKKTASCLAIVDKYRQITIIRYPINQKQIPVSGALRQLISLYPHRYQVLYKAALNIEGVLPLTCPFNGSESCPLAAVETPARLLLLL